MSAHTPGPWLDVSDPPTNAKFPGGRQAMALVSTHAGTTCIDCTGSGAFYAEDCAKARLIAAAPDLLSACEEALRSLLADGHEHYREVATLRQAIAKATGSRA